MRCFNTACYALDLGVPILLRLVIQASVLPLKFTFSIRIYLDTYFLHRVRVVE